MWAWGKLGCLGTSLLLCTIVLFGGCTRETLQLDESFALCGVRSDELKDSTLVVPWNDSGFQPADGRDSELHLLGLSSHSGASIVTPRGCFIVPKQRPFVLVHLRENGRGFVLPSSALEGRPRLMRATLGPIADVPLARRCGLVETADASAWLSLTTSEGRPLLAEDLTFETLDAAPGKSGASDVKKTIESPLNAKRVSPLGCVARSEFSATAPRLVTQKSTRLAAYLGLQESGTASLRVDSALGSDFFRRCRVNPDDDLRALLAQTLSGKADANNSRHLLSVVGAATADIVTANFSVCTTAGSSEGCPQSAWEDVARTAGSHGLRRIGACILAPRDDGRALASLRVSMQGERAFFAFLKKPPDQATSISSLRVMEIPSAARFRETVRFEIGRCLVDPAGRVRNVHEKQSFDARLAGGEVAGIAGSFVPSKLIWTAHAANGTTRQLAFPLNEPFGALPFESIGFPFDTTSSSEWVDARLEVRFPSGETVVLEEAGGCRLSPWPASVAKVDVAERDLGFMARGNARSLEELGIDRSAVGLNNERIRYAYAFGPTAPGAGERWFADGASCLAEKGWKEVRDGVVSFLIPGRFGLSIRACNPAGGSATPWTFRATVSSSVPNFELAWIDPLQLAPVPTIGSFRASVPFEVRDLRDDVLPWKDLAASASCEVFIIDRSPVTNTSLTCSLEPDHRLRVLKGRVKFATQGLTGTDFNGWVDRRLRVVVRVGAEDVDRRDRFLEAEIPRYVLQGHVPVVDVLPDAALRMDICGTGRTEDGTQYALMADGTILRIAPDGSYWEPFASMSSQATAFVQETTTSRRICASFYELVSWSSGELLVTPVRVKVDEFEAGLSSASIPELCEGGQCNPLFSIRNGWQSIRVLVRNESTVAALIIDGATSVSPRLVSRTRGHAEVEADIATVDPVGARSNPDLRILHDGELLVQFHKRKVKFSPVSMAMSEMPQAFLDDGWEGCRPWPTSEHFACSSDNILRILNNDSILEIPVIETPPGRGTSFQILAVETSSNAVFVAFVLEEDVLVRKFDSTGNSLWSRSLFKWHEGRHSDSRKYPLVFSYVNGDLTFLNGRCQGFTFNDAGVLINSNAPLGLRNDDEFSCAHPAMDRGEVVFFDPTFGKLRAVETAAITWNQVASSYSSGTDWSDKSSLFRVLTRTRLSGRDLTFDLNTFDDSQATFVLPADCSTGFDGLAKCQSELSKIPTLDSESISQVIYGRAHSLDSQVIKAPASENDFFMEGTYIHLIDEERFLHASRNGVLLIDAAKRLIFLRVDANKEPVRQVLPTNGTSWQERIRDAGAIKTATFGRVAIACAGLNSLQDCFVWTAEGLIGNLSQPGSAFSSDARAIADFRFFYVAGWGGVGVSYGRPDGYVIGTFVFNDEEQLEFVERITVQGDQSDFDEAMGGEFVSVSNKLLSRVQDGVWELGSGKRLVKRTGTRKRENQLIPNIDTGNPALPHVGTLTSVISAEGEHGWNVIVLPHFAYE